MTTQTQRADTLHLIASSAAIISNLPELPGYNGSVLMIDDIEAKRIESDLCKATSTLTECFEIVELQAKDDGLWFEPKTAPEAYLQSALRKLHERIGVLK